MYYGCASGDKSKGEARNGNDNKGEARIQYNKGEARITATITKARPVTDDNKGWARLRR